MLSSAIEDMLEKAEAIRLRIDPDAYYSIQPDSLRPYAGELLSSSIALQHADRRAPRNKRLILTLVARLSRAIEHAVLAEQRVLLDQVSAELDNEQEISNKLDLENYGYAVASAARERGLVDARQRRKTEQEAKLEALRPEFERLIGKGLSGTRAAQILSDRSSIHPDTIRKRLRRKA